MSAGNHDQAVIATVRYSDELLEETLCDVEAFWRAHDVYPTRDEMCADIAAWTREGHALYVIFACGAQAGFFHMGSRGAGMDWLEDIFVKREFRGRGIATTAIRFAEELVMRDGGECMYMEVVPRNEAALRLYHSLGYDILNTVTVRRDFCEKEQKSRKERIADMEYRVIEK